MRDIINKGFTEDKILEAAKSAFRAGWTKIKLYFIIGLPYEKVEDCTAIGELAHKIADQYYELPKSERN